MPAIQNEFEQIEGRIYIDVAGMAKANLQLNKFERKWLSTFQKMGFSTTQVTKSMDKWNKSVQSTEQHVNAHGRAMDRAKARVGWMQQNLPDMASKQRVIARTQEAAVQQEGAMHRARLEGIRDLAILDGEMKGQITTKDAYKRQMGVLNNLEKQGADQKSINAKKIKIETEARKNGIFTAKTSNKHLKDLYATQKNLNSTTLSNVLSMAKWAVGWFVLYRAIRFVTSSITAAVGSAIEFNQIVHDMAAIMRGSFEKAEELGGEITKLSIKYGIAVKDIGEGTKMWVRQGMEQTEVQEAMRAAMLLSTVAFMDQKEAVKSLTAIMRTYDLEASNLIGVVDKLAAVGSTTAATEQELAKAYTVVGASANEAGVSIDQLNSLLAHTIATTQRGGTEVARSFRMMFARLARPETVGKLFSITKLMTLTAEGAQDTYTVLLNLAGGWDKLTETQKRAVGQTLGGVRQIDKMMVALKDWTALQNIYTTSQSATNDAMAKANDILDGQAKQIAIAKEEFKLFGRVIGEQITPIWVGFAKVLGKVAGAIATGGKELEEYEKITGRQSYYR
jgi:TP901 family phage tail tape measure protein